MLTEVFTVACVTRMKFVKTLEAKPWDTETMGNLKYPLELFLRVVTMGLEMMKVVDGLPKLDISVKSSL